MADLTDSIERQIDIDAPSAGVGPGVRAGLVHQRRRGRRPPHRAHGDVDVVHDPVHGAFRFRTVDLDPPRYAAFRWLSDQPGPDDGEAGTLVEFWVDERPTGVTLRVVESGFASLGGTDEDRRRRVAENTEGWETELAAAERHLAGHTAGNRR